MMKKLITIGILILLIGLLSGCTESQKPFEITEVVCGTVEKVEGQTIFFKNDSYSGIVKGDGSILWDGSKYSKNQYVGELYIDNLNGFDISNLTGNFVSIRLHGVMNEQGNLISKILAIG